MIRRLALLPTRCVLLSVICCVAMAGGEIRADDELFWAESGIEGTDDTGTIQRSNLDGTGQSEIVGGLNFPAGIAVDALNAKIYWVDIGTGLIQRANLDGTNIQTIIDNLPLFDGAALTFDIAIDPINNKIYWAEGVNGKIQRADADALNSNIEDIVTGLFGPTGIALDVENRVVFWTDLLTGEVQSADADGFNLSVTTLVTGLSEVFGLAQDPFNAHIYFSDLATDQIERADDFGLNLNRLVILTGLNDPTYVALDVLNGTIYWSDEGSGTVRRANLDGTGEIEIALGASNPSGVDVATSTVCAFVSNLVADMDAFRTAFPGTGDDLDGDGIPEDALLLLFQEILCFMADTQLGQDTLAAFQSNLTTFDGEASAIQLAAFRELIAALMMTSADMQTDLKAILSNGGSPLAEVYAIVTVNGANAFAGSSDLDGDGVTNSQELTNVINRGGSFLTWVGAVTNPALDGTGGEFRLDGGSGSVCFIATAAYGSPLAARIGELRAWRDTRMMPNALGAMFADSYYRLSPALAERIAADPLSRSAVRAGIETFLGLLAVPYSIVVVLGAGIIVAGVRRRRELKR